MEILDIIISFLAACLAGVGVGGGGLLVIYLTLVKKLPQNNAQGINLVFFVCCMCLALLFHIYKRRVYKKILPTALPFCISGGIIGSFMAAYIKTELLSVLFGWFLIISGILSLYNSKNKKEP